MRQRKVGKTSALQELLIGSPLYFSLTILPSLISLTTLHTEYIRFSWQYLNSLQAM
jgi:hypothetical protein